MTRKDQVIARLAAAKGDWVDGTALATEEVGGSEGLKRLREARADGWAIEERRHPDSRRAIWQYRLRPGVGPLRPTPPAVEAPRPARPTAPRAEWHCAKCGADVHESRGLAARRGRP